MGEFRHLGRDDLYAAVWINLSDGPGFLVGYLHVAVYLQYHGIETHIFRGIGGEIGFQLFEHFIDELVLPFMVILVDIDMEDSTAPVLASLFAALDATYGRCYEIRKKSLG